MTTIECILKGDSLKKYVRRKEWKLIQIALADSKNNISQAAQLLGIKRTTLSIKIKQMRKEELCSQSLPPLSPSP